MEAALGYKYSPSISGRFCRNDGAALGRFSFPPSLPILYRLEIYLDNPVNRKVTDKISQSTLWCLYKLTETTEKNVSYLIDAK